MSNTCSLAYLSRTFISRFCIYLHPLQLAQQCGFDSGEYGELSRFPGKHISLNPQIIVICCVFFSPRHISWCKKSLFSPSPSKHTQWLAHPLIFHSSVRVWNSLRCGGRKQTLTVCQKNCSFRSWLILVVSVWRENSGFLQMWITITINPYREGIFDCILPQLC